MVSKSIFLSAGDPSGDNAAARLLDALNDRHPNLQCFGLGGPRLKKMGQEQFVDGRELAVLGFWEVARRFRFFQKLLNRTVREIRDRRPACVVLVDYPGFNLRLAERIKQLGIPIVYYISPQVWAWGGKRIEKIKRLVDLMLSILPFETPYFEKHGLPARFVGHYLLEDIPKEMVASQPPVEGHLALLPGSRPQEIERMLPTMLVAAELFNRQHGTRAVVAGLSSIGDKSIYDKIMGKSDSNGVVIEYDNAREIIHQSSLVLAASGTATLEAGIIGRPMVVIYKTGFLTYQIARWLVKLEMIGLVNLVAGELIVPELIQNEASPERIVDELEKYWQDQSLYEKVRTKLNTVPGLLGGEGASVRAAELIGRYL